MDFRQVRKVLESTELWLGVAMFLAGLAGVMYGSGQVYRGIFCIVLALACANKVVKNNQRLRRRVQYIINAAMNGDFSYKFPVNGVAEHEKEINRSLNQLVAHLETLSDGTRQNERFLGVIINLVDTGIIVADANGNVVHHNRAALSLLSLPVLTNVCQLPSDQSALTIKKTATTLHGQALTVYTINDMRRPLQAAEVESWEKLTRVLTHEIMNSLTPIHSIAESISAVAADDSELASQLQVITSSTQSLMHFVRNFRKFTVLPTPQPKVLYIKPFLEKSVALASQYPATEDINFTVAVFPPDAMAYADESMLNQVIVNILKNAVESHPRTIEVSARILDDESVEISIANDGALIPAEIASQIFTPFFTTKPGGSGIGLSLSRRIISTLGGTLTLTITPRTRFVIRL